MTGWNMPPGSNVSDIPGNRPEDQETEAFFDAFYSLEKKTREALGGWPHSTCSDTYVVTLADWAWNKMGEAYGKGYADGVAYERLARTFEGSVDPAKADIPLFLQTQNRQPLSPEQKERLAAVKWKTWEELRERDK